MIPNQQNILHCLPLLASVLGQKYGVKVSIGGTRAETNGREIQLPSLPINCDENFIGVVRGYIDHESAHIRFSDFELMQNASITAFEKFVWNSLEDRRIEQLMSKTYGGSKHNLQWLAHHIFVDSPKSAWNKDCTSIVSNWLLLTVRSWDLSEISSQIPQYEQSIQTLYPQLLSQVKPILDEAKDNCFTTADTLEYAKRIADCMKQEDDKQSSNEGDKDDPSSQSATNPSGDTEQSPCDEQSMDINEVLNAKESSLPQTLGEKAQELINHLSIESTDTCEVSQEKPIMLDELSSENIQNIQRATASLKARLHSLFQAKTLTHCLRSTHGKINTSRLHALSVQDTKVFLKQGVHKQTDTAIHILLDNSSSMTSSAELVSCTGYAIVSALQGMKGITAAVSAFPARFRGIIPIVKMGERLHRRFMLNPVGNTPMTEALWYTITNIVQRPEPRKIILIVTDGEPDNLDTTKKTIAYAEKIGIEVLGIGIGSPCIVSLLPHTSTRITRVEDLPQAMFTLLQHQLLNQ